MRKALLTAALVGLLALIADVRQAAAQFAQPQRAPPQTLAPEREILVPRREIIVPERRTVATERSSKARKTKTATQEQHAKAHRKHHAKPAPPNQRKIAEKNGYKPVSELVNFPKFFPGLGILYVKPDTLPLGPFLCFDREDRLVATVYMVPIKDIDDHKTMEAAGFAGAHVDHVSFYFNAGHPGVDMPHYHVVIWHVTKKEEARVAK